MRRRGVSVVYAATLKLSGDNERSGRVARSLQAALNAEGVGRPENWFSRERAALFAVVGEDDKVVNRWTLHATHTGDFRGIPATNKRITITGIGIFRFSEDGKVVESWDSLDQLGMLRQLEAV